MKKRKIVTLMLAFLSFITIAFSVGTFTANAAPQWSNTYLQEYYAQGDSLTIVERKITLDDGTVLTPTITELSALLISKTYNGSLYAIFKPFLCPIV